MQGGQARAWQTHALHREPVKKNQKKQLVGARTAVTRVTVCPPPLTFYLVDGKANGVDVLAVAAVPATVLLHQRHQEAADGLLILGVVVLL